MFRERQRGFVPAWFMDGAILLTIVGLLIAIIVPAVFHALAARSVGRALAAATPVQAQVAAYILREGRPPHDNAAAGLAAPSSFAAPDLQSIAVIDGEILLRISGNVFVDGKAVVLSPVFDPAKRDAPIEWRCQDSGMLDPGLSVEVAGVYTPVAGITEMAVLPERCRKPAP